ncbi:Transposase [Caenorhabditis elegans]|uniref:Transposase n=1 Tax=Caenorhabditis elegans TaxID=6239 RepID=C6S3M1_CAEEL|nr:Transposase [Caenorhabditis elegans]CBA11616.2 Transposase [Caenorhabditis elegans]|eukprot:NP_001256927.1 Uncharacterized protein CELE_Y38H6C.24 [Caenorhabditis elegans]
MSVNIGAVLMIFVYAINFYLLFQGFDFKSSFRSEETLIDSYNGSIQENGKRIMFQGLSLRS